MTRQSEPTKGRRKFLKDALRASLVGGFAFTGVLLGSRKRTDSQGRTVCPAGLPCRDCAVLGNCGKSRAAAARKEREEPRPALSGGPGRRRP